MNDHVPKKIMVVGILGSGPLFEGISIAEMNGITTPAQCMTKSRRRPIDWFGMEE